MTYGASPALKMAAKATAKASPLDTGGAIAGLCFLIPLSRARQHGLHVLLKGGQDMLARTLDARNGLAAAWRLLGGRADKKRSGPKS